MCHPAPLRFRLLPDRSNVAPCPGARPHRAHRTRLVHALAILLTTGLAGPAVAAGQTAETVELLNGIGLAGWRKPTGEWRTAKSVSLDSSDQRRFDIQGGAGVLVNGAQGRTVNLLSQAEHGDVEAHIEFVVPQGSNSGVYFQARYEIQVFDSWGVTTPKYSDCGGIYERWRDDQGFEGQPPRVNASRAPGEWQTFDVVFRAPRFAADGRKLENARFVKVLHNGVLVHENVEVTGPTRAATYESDEKPLGPLMLQGDHGPVAYRHIRLRPLALP